MGIIAGIKNHFEADKKSAILTKMLSAQAHRDPMRPITYSNKDVAMGMANGHDYSIPHCTDLYSTTHHHICSVVDGIVLNQQDLKKHFEKDGISITRLSGSAIVSLAYEKWGYDFMRYLEGEFSCAVYDFKKSAIILVRDPYGHKPLHYYYQGADVFFSSEVKGILAAGVQREIDLVSLSDYMSLNCIPFPETIFKNIRQVPPGAIVVLSSEGMKTIKYWKCDLSEDETLSLPDAVNMVSDAIRNAVKKRMVSDNTFCFLSGGVDSSIVVSFASELSSTPVNAVTVSFDEAEANELEDAQAMAKHVGAKLFHVTAKPSSFYDMLETVIYHHDSPFTDTSAYPTYYAAQLARQFTDVILTGDGPDQTLGGSSHHVFALLNDLFAPRNSAQRILYGLASGMMGLVAPIPRNDLLFKIRRNFYRKSLRSVSALYDIRSYFPDLVKKFIVNRDLWSQHCAHRPFRHPENWFSDAGLVSGINKYLYADIQFYVPDDLMVKVDRMSMAHGLETLSPFQDVQLAKVVNTLPVAYKIALADGTVITKRILREIGASRFPERVKNKKKQGFGIPLEKWLRINNGAKLKEILFDDRCLNRGYFNKQNLMRFVNDFIACNGDFYYPSANGITSLLTFEIWCRKYIDD